MHLATLSSFGSTPRMAVGLWHSFIVLTQWHASASCQCVCRLVTDSDGDDLCTDGLRVDFTNFTWPTGVKQDRGFNISFTKDIILPPNGGWAGGKATTSSANVALSFKDNKNAYRQDLLSCLASCMRDGAHHTLMSGCGNN